MSYGVILSDKNGQSAAKGDSIMSKKTTLEEFKKQIEERQPGRDYTFMGFDGMMKPLTVICNKCGFQKSYTTAQTFRNIKSHFQCRCPEYSKRSGGFKRAHTLQSYQQEIDKRFGEGKLKLLKFTKVLEPVEAECLRCHRIRTVCTGSKLLNAQNACFYCDSDKLRQSDYQIKINEIFGENEYTIVECEDVRNPKMLIRHKCGFIFSRKYYDFIKSMGCPKCKGRMSKGELKINNYLTKLGVNFQKEYRKGLQNQFSFDFAVFLPNSDYVFAFIEYDGQQHFPGPRPPQWKSYEEQHADDLKKNELVKTLGIPMLRIPYTDFNNIEQLILEFLTFNDYPISE